MKVDTWSGPLAKPSACSSGDLNLLTTYSTRKDISRQSALGLAGDRWAQAARFRNCRRRRRVAAADEKAIGDDQERIRKNMLALDHADALYKRYASELDAQETRIATLRQEAARLRDQAQAAERDLRVYIDNLPAIE